MTSAAEQTPEPSIDLSVFDGAADLMCVRDMQGRLVRVNRAWQETLGLSVEEVQNAPLLPLVHPADVPDTLLRMTEADRCQQIVNFVNRYRRKDGVYRHMEWRAQRLGDVVLGRARDVTALRLRESELDLARQTLERTLANISSQVRAPADEILHAVQALDRTTLTDAQRVMLQTMGRAVETLGDLVSQMVEREREAAWATFLPTLERRRSAMDTSIKVGSALDVSRPADQKEIDNRSSVLARPPVAVQSWLVDTLRLTDEDRIFHNSLRDLPSQTLGLLSIHLDHVGQFHPRRLQSLSTKSGLMSAGRAAALLARMQDIGFVEVVGEYQAGQARRYRVLPALVQPIARQLVVNLRSMATSNYKAAVALEAIKSDNKRLITLLARYGETLTNARRFGRVALGRHLNGVPSTAQGQSIALSIGAAAMEKHGPTWEGWIEIALTSYAKRFEVSRVHVRRVITNLEACGLILDPASPSRLLVTCGFRKEIENYRNTLCYTIAAALDRFV